MSEELKAVTPPSPCPGDSGVPETSVGQYSQDCCKGRRLSSPGESEAGLGLPIFPSLPCTHSGRPSVQWGLNPDPHSTCRLWASTGHSRPRVSGQLELARVPRKCLHFNKKQASVGKPSLARWHILELGDHACPLLAPDDVS